jgi:hypothetical protein
VGIGTAWLLNPRVFSQVTLGLKSYLDQKQTTVEDLIGLAHGG